MMPISNPTTGNALFGYADILLNGKDPAVQDWPRALETARYAVARTERRDPRLLGLLAQALRLNNFPAEAFAAAEEAAKLLPPPDKRTADDIATAKEIRLRTGRLKGVASAHPKSGSQSQGSRAKAGGVARVRCERKKVIANRRLLASFRALTKTLWPKPAG